MLTQLRHPLVAVTLTLACTVPWIGLVVTSGGYGTVHPGENVAAIIIVFIAGFTIIGATFTYHGGLKWELSHPLPEAQ